MKKDWVEKVASQLDEETGIFDNDICIFPYTFKYDGEDYYVDEEGGASDSYLSVFMLDDDGNLTMIKDEYDDEYKMVEFEDFMKIING